MFKNLARAAACGAPPCREPGRGIAFDGPHEKPTPPHVSAPAVRAPMRSERA
jgi:hypothetical protein